MFRKKDVLVNTETILIFGGEDIAEGSVFKASENEQNDFIKFKELDDKIVPVSSLRNATKEEWFKYQYPKIDIISSNEKKRVTFVRLKDGREAKAICSPGDTFSYDAGILFAYERACKKSYPLTSGLDICDMQHGVIFGGRTAGKQARMSDYRISRSEDARVDLYPISFFGDAIVKQSDDILDAFKYSIESIQKRTVNAQVERANHQALEPLKIELCNRVKSASGIPDVLQMIDMVIDNFCRVR